MIPAKGGEAQRQLGQIAAAHHHAAHLVGLVHQHLGALPRLGVFKGGVKAIRRLLNVLKMLDQGFM